MSKGDFVASMDRLLEQSEGKWTAHCEVDQVYAHYQEVHPEFHHPDGGSAFYLRDSVYLGDHIRTVAERILTEDGLDVTGALAAVAEDISKGVYQRAPWEFADLRASGHPYVTRDGAKVYDRPPMVHRLDKEELRAKAHLRYLFDPHRYDYDRTREV